jgi:hypothetical protein
MKASTCKTPRRRLEDCIEMGLKEMGWINLAQDMHRWRTFVEDVYELLVSMKYGNSLTS